MSTTLRSHRRHPLRLDGSVAATIAAFTGADDSDALAPWRAVAHAHDVDDVAIVAFERLARLGALEGDAQIAFVVACIMVEARAKQGSSGHPLGLPPSFDAFFALVDDHEVNREARARVAAGLSALIASCDALPEDARVIGRGGERRPLVIDGDVLMFHAHRAAEVSIAADVRALLAAAREEDDGVDDVARVMVDVLDTHPLTGGGVPLRLAAAQVRAVACALSSRFVIVTGGPGTGKTSVITSIVRALARAGVAPDEISLAAPTGRAAKRMAESIGAGLASVTEPLESDRALMERLPTARTLHRVLGSSRHTRAFKVTRELPLFGRALIVDECSMVSLSLMAALLAAVPRDRAFVVVLVGDAHQLPSVETGDVLRALTSGARGTSPTIAARLHGIVEANHESPSLASLSTTIAGPTVADGSVAAHTVWLDAVYRQGQDAGGQHIARLASSLRAHENGQTAPDEPVAHDRVDALTFSGVERLAWLGATKDERALHLDAFLARYARRFFDDSAFASPLASGFERADPRLIAYVQHRLRARVLCFTHGGLSGEVHVNARLAALTARRRTSGFAFAGAPLLVLENDRALGLANGDQGVVVPVLEDGAPRLMAAFIDGDDVRLVPRSLLPASTLAFAMTVHKSQGSEYAHVALVLPERANRLLVRETLYTGLTRAKQGVVVVGSREMWMHGVETPVARTSTLRARIEGPLP